MRRRRCTTSQAVELLPVVAVGRASAAPSCSSTSGDAHWRSGNGPGRPDRRSRTRSTRAAGRSATASCWRESVLGYVTALGGFLLYARFEVGEAAVGLLEEVLAALPPEDSPLRAHALAHLALEMWSANEPVEERVAVSERGDRDGPPPRRFRRRSYTALHARSLDTHDARDGARAARAHRGDAPGREGDEPAGDRVPRPQRAIPLLPRAVRPPRDGGRDGRDDGPRGAPSPALLPLAHGLPAHAPRDAGRPVRRGRAAGRRRRSSSGGSGRANTRATSSGTPRCSAIRWAQGRLAELWPRTGVQAERFHAERFPWVARWRDALAAAELGDHLSGPVRSSIAMPWTASLSFLRDGLWALHVASLADACVLRRATMRHGRSSCTTCCSRSPTTTPCPTPSSRSARWRCGSGSSPRFWAAGRTPTPTSPPPSPAASCSAPARSARETLIEYATVLARRGEPARPQSPGGSDSTRRSTSAPSSDTPELLNAPPRRCAPAPRAATTLRPCSGARASCGRLAWGEQTVRLRDVKGLGYLAVAAREPRAGVPLWRSSSGAASGQPAETPSSAAAAGLNDVARQSDTGPVLDAEAKDAYGRRLAELDEELEEARGWHDDERAARLAEERDFIASELGRAVGLGERDRSFASPEERARVSVTKAIRTAIKLVRKQCPELGEHLEARRSEPGASAPTPHRAPHRPPGRCNRTRGTVVPPKFTPLEQETPKEGFLHGHHRSGP